MKWGSGRRTSEVSPAPTPSPPPPAPPPAAPARPNVGTYTLGGSTGAAIPNVPGGTWGSTVRHQYSKVGAWNCDQTMLFLLNQGGSPGVVFFNATTTPPVPINIAAFSSSEFRWHPTQPNVAIVARGNQIITRNVLTGAETVVYTATGYGSITLGEYEGNPSDDGEWIVVTPDLATSKKVLLLNLISGVATEVVHGWDFVDWAGVSALGNYVLVNGGPGSDNIRCFARSNLTAPLWTVLDYGYPSHFDVTVDGGGNECIAGVSQSTLSGFIHKRRLSDGVVSQLNDVSFGVHTSARNFKSRGYVVSNFTVNSPDKGYLVSLNGGAHIDIGTVVYNADYWSQPQITVSPDGSQFLWAVTSGTTIRANLLVRAL